MNLLRALLLIPICLSAQDFSDIKIEKASAGLTFTEGPVWHKDGYLLFSDVPNSRIHRFDPGKGTTVYMENTNRTNGNTFDTQGRLYRCETGERRVTRTDRKGRVEVLADRWEGKRLNATNDIVVRRDNHIYFTDPAFGSRMDTLELDFFGIYHIPSKGAMELVARWKGRPNGIAIAPNGRTLYVADTDGRLVKAFDLDRNGKASNERVAISGVDGPPDGIKVDEKGNIYVTCRGLAVYAPDGKRLAMIEIPETPANCAWGDADYRGMYITARTSVYRIRLDVKGSLQYASVDE
jgi:gluconolactonase